MRFTPGWVPDPAKDLREIADRLPGLPVRKFKGVFARTGDYEVGGPCRVIVRLNGKRSQVMATFTTRQNWTIGLTFGMVLALSFWALVAWDFPVYILFFLGQFPNLCLLLLNGVHRRHLKSLRDALSKPIDATPRSKDRLAVLPPPGAGVAAAKPARRRKSAP